MFGREGGHVIRLEGGHALRRALDCEAEHRGQKRTWKNHVR